MGVDKNVIINEVEKYKSRISNIASKLQGKEEIELIELGISIEQNLGCLSEIISALLEELEK